MSAMASQIMDVSIVYPTVCSGEDKKHRSSVSLAIGEFLAHRASNAEKGQVTLKMFPYDYVIMEQVHIAAI